MVFIVIEVQSTGESAAVLQNSYTNRNEAESKFHEVLKYAAISTVPMHSAVLMTDSGKTLKAERYEHEVTEE